MKLIPRTIPGKILAAIGALVLLLVIIAVAQGASKTDLSSDSASAATQGSSSTTTATPAAAKIAKHTVRFVVTGSPADVTYGHGGSSTHGGSPMNITEPLIGNATDYTLTAVLGDAGGVVKVKIYVDGKLIAHAKATGAFQAADAIITKDPFTDQWESGLGG
jgi:hypothetical protein